MFQQKYYIAVMLVRVTTVEQLIEKVKKGKFRSREDILAQSTCSTFRRECIVLTPAGKQAIKVEDDDIVAGPQKTSLKCPVSIPTPHAVVTLIASIFS
jgi:E3 SUMO-protein ligase PIAS1